MTEEKLCGGKTFKEVMDEVNFHIHDKHKIEQLEKENAELKKDKEWLDNTNNEQTKIILKLQAQIEKMKEHCDCEYCINVISGDEFTVENTNKTVCEYCMENNKKLWKLAE